MGNFKIRQANPADFNGVEKLLLDNKLPAEDINKDLPNFFVATDKDSIIGAIGFEVYADNGLLRSMVIDTAHRKHGIAAALINELFTDARKKNLKEMYLLTETAADYFTKKDFQRVERDQVPESLKQSSEFSHVCPSSAIVMKKKI